MRVKEFLFRTGIFIPITVLAMIVLVMTVGMIISLLGARSILSSGIYCNTCMAAITLAMGIVLIYQVIACCKET